ncbi:O-methyltransferase [Microthyrium microscopicum]|uniref:O-methyltransferase n=1 Tax=Microthyrium microscopicum TaxID=703497 RepID=A0A6A6UG81_9PEZI|nr:O-methyltransferase [Microthyrium microscopicum]
MADSREQSFDKTYWRTPKSFRFEADERWSAVDKYNWSHLHAGNTKPDPDMLEKVLQSSTDGGLPPIAVSPAHGKFLQIQARLMGAKNIMEVGMLGGYSTIWLASSSPDAKVTSIEIDEDFAALAKKHFGWAGVEKQIEVKVGSAMSEMPKLVEEVKAGKREKIDLAFIDANKPNNLEYFNWCVEMARPGACIIIDNVVRMGRVVDPSAFEDPNVAGTRRAIEAIGKDSRVDATILQMVGDKSYDGFLTAIVKRDASGSSHL